MLRFTVIFLLVCHIALFAFERLKPPDAEQPATPVAPARPSDLPEIRLLSEISADDLAAMDLRRCFSLGPFESGDVIRARLNRARTGDGWAQVRTTEALVDRGYWIHLPAFENLDDAYAASRRIKAAGVTDVAVLTSGEFPRTVSLGYYQVRDSAEQRMAELRAAGIEPRMNVRRDNETRYWLDYEPGAVGDVVTALADAPGVQNRPMPCPARPEPVAPEATVAPTVVAEGSGSVNAAGGTDADEPSPLATTPGPVSDGAGAAGDGEASAETGTEDGTVSG